MDDRPPDLPPKQSRRYPNGAIPGVGNGSAVTEEVPPVLPRRKKEQVYSSNFYGLTNQYMLFTLF